MRFLRVSSAALLLAVTAACETFDGLTELEVVNQNQPDRARAVVTAGDVEALISGSFNTMWDAMGYNTAYGLMPMGAMADEWTLSWGNYDLRALSSEPRTPYNNSPSYTYQEHAEFPWFIGFRAISSIYDGFKAIENDSTGQLCAQIDCDRALAFGKFVQGLGHAWMALYFDSAFVLTEAVPDLETAELSLLPYQEVWDSAEAQLRAAITMSQGATWQLDAGWIGASGNTLTGSQLAQLIYAHLVRFQPWMARNPTQRAAVEWAQVITDHNNAVTSDFFVEADADLWWSAALYFNFINFDDNSWSRADYKTIGVYDQGGGYATWLGTDINSRTEFLLSTPDRRIHGAGGATDAGTNFRYDGPSPFPPARGRYHFSFYSGTTYESWAAVEVGPMPYFLKRELDLYRAEAVLRTAGVTQEVVDIINSTRVTKGQMSALTTGSSFNEVYDALVYERRIEAWGYCSGCSYFNRRGEGGLSATAGPGPEGAHTWVAAQNHHWGMVEGTPLHFAPPGKELEVLEKPIYTYGGVGSEGPTTAPAAYRPGGGTRVPAKLVYIPPEQREKRVSPSRMTSLVRY